MMIPCSKAGCLGNLDRIATHTTDPPQPGTHGGGSFRFRLSGEHLPGFQRGKGDKGDKMEARELMNIEKSKERPERK